MWLRRRNYDTGPEDSQAAMEAARKGLRKAERRGNEVNKVSKALRDQLKDVDRFAEALEAIIVSRKAS